MLESKALLQPSPHATCCSHGCSKPFLQPSQPSGPPLQLAAFHFPHFLFIAHAELESCVALPLALCLARVWLASTTCLRSPPGFLSLQHGSYYWIHDTVLQMEARQPDCWSALVRVSAAFGVLRLSMGGTTTSARLVLRLPTQLCCFIALHLVSLAHGDRPCVLKVFPSSVPELYQPDVDYTPTPCMRQAGAIAGGQTCHCCGGCACAVWCTISRHIHRHTLSASVAENSFRISCKETSADSRQRACLAGSLFEQEQVGACLSHKRISLLLQRQV